MNWGQPRYLAAACRAWGWTEREVAVAQPDEEVAVVLVVPARLADSDVVAPVALVASVDSARVAPVDSVPAVLVDSVPAVPVELVVRVVA